MDVGNFTHGIVGGLVGISGGDFALPVKDGATIIVSLGTTPLPSTLLVGLNISELLGGSLILSWGSTQIYGNIIQSLPYVGLNWGADVPWASGLALSVVIPEDYDKDLAEDETEKDF